MISGFMFTCITGTNAFTRTKLPDTTGSLVRIGQECTGLLLLTEHEPMEGVLLLTLVLTGLLLQILLVRTRLQG